MNGIPMKAAQSPRVAALLWLLGGVGDDGNLPAGKGRKAYENAGFDKLLDPY
jgi:hypothetical protein